MHSTHLYLCRLATVNVVANSGTDTGTLWWFVISVDI